MDDEYLRRWTWDERQAWLAMVEAHAYLLGALDHDLRAGSGVELAHYQVLAQLSAAPGWRMPISELALRCGLTPGGIRRRFDVMEEERLVERRRESGEAKLFAGLTLHGHEVLEVATPTYLQSVRSHFLDPLGKRDLQLLASALQRLLGAFDDRPPGGGPAPSGSPEERTAWLLFVEAESRLFSALDRELQDACGMELGRYEVLAHLADQPDWQLRMSDLSARCGLSRSGITRRLDPMERDGLIERKVAEGDRRGVVGALTDRGYAALLAAAPTHIAGVRRHFLDFLGEDELRVVFKVLSQIVNRIRSNTT